MVMDNYKPDFLGAVNGYRNLIGDQPEPIVQIKRILVGFASQTGFETVIAHGLVKGEKVKIVPTNADSYDTMGLLNGCFTVSSVPNPKVFTIASNFKSGMWIEGTWQRGGNCEIINCQPGYHLENGECVVDTTKPNTWVWWVIGGMAVLATGIIAYKIIKRRKNK